MKEPLGAFEIEARPSESRSGRRGSFARGALIALPLSLAVWLVVYLVL